MVRCRNSSICFLELAHQLHFGSQHRAIVAHHHLPQQFDGRKSLLQHLIVEFLERKAAPIFFL